MSAVQQFRPVIVTGASGFIAKYVIAELLKRDFTVRGSLRDLGKADAVRNAVAGLGADPAKLTFFLADLTKDDGWDTGIDGAVAVMHLASPCPAERQGAPEASIAAARDGTLRVMLAAHRAIAKRVVLTSSTVAVMYGAGPLNGKTFTEADFSDETNAKLTPFIKSKTLAERTAWTFVNTKLGAPELTVIAPGVVQGPALDADLSVSHKFLLSLANGRFKALPKISFPVCDVRDVASAHTAAMLSPAAAGQRFIVAGGEARLFDMCQKLVAELPDLQDKVPRFEWSDTAVRLRALSDDGLRAMLPDIGCHRVCSSDKAREVLGLSFRSADEAIGAAARSLRALQLL